MNPLHAIVEKARTVRPSERVAQLVQLVMPQRVPAEGQPGFSFSQLHIDVARNAIGDFNPFHDPVKWHRIQGNPFGGPIVMGFQLEMLLLEATQRRRAMEEPAAGGAASCKRATERRWDPVKGPVFHLTSNPCRMQAAGQADAVSSRRKSCRSAMPRTSWPARWSPIIPTSTNWRGERCFPNSSPYRSSLRRCWKRRPRKGMTSSKTRWSIPLMPSAWIEACYDSWPTVTVSSSWWMGPRRSVPDEVAECFSPACRNPAGLATGTAADSPGAKHLKRTTFRLLPPGNRRRITTGSVGFPLSA